MTADPRVELLGRRVDLGERAALKTDPDQQPLTFEAGLLQDLG